MNFNLIASNYQYLLIRAKIITFIRLLSGLENTSMSKLIVEIGLILGVLVIAILIFFQTKNKNRNNYFLILTLSTVLFSLFVNYLNSTRIILEFPFLIRTGNITAYLIFSFLYIYTRNSFYPGRFWQKKDIFLILPSFFYILDMLPFFLVRQNLKLL